MLEGRNAIQRDLDRLDRCAQANLMMGSEWLESRSEEKDLGVSTEKRFNMSQQCALAAQKANCILGCIKRSVTSRSRKVVLPLYSGVLCPVLGPQHKMDMELLE